MTRIAIVYHSATGRTRSLAEAVVRGAAEVAGTETHLISVDDRSNIHALLAHADAIVFGCPTYMGSASAPFKAFMDSTSAVWALQGWRDKLAAAFTHSAALSGDKLGTLTQLAVFAAQHGMVWIGLGLPPTYAAVDVPGEDTNRLGSHLGAMAQSRPGSGAVPESDLRTAALLGRRVAEAAHRWRRDGPAMAVGDPAPPRHVTAREWTFPDPKRSPPPPGTERTNLRELAARPERFEHHLTICATVDGVQLEIATASEPLYFAHINHSDEYAIALPSGDELVDRFPLRTFLSDPESGEDAGRYNHRVGDLVLHPERWLHWPGRLRPPFEPFDFPPGMRRAGLSLVYCASRPTPATWCPLPIAPERSADVKTYRQPAPPMALASLRGEPRTLATIGRTTLALVELPDAIAPAHGGWAVILEATPASAHAAGDLYRIAAGARVDGSGIVRALVLESDTLGPDPVPPAWSAAPRMPFVPFEEAAAGSLPFAAAGLVVEERGPTRVAVSAGATLTAEVPRYWLARLLFRVGLHELRLGYVETYGGFFVDDRGGDAVQIGLRAGTEREAVIIPRGEALALVEGLYRAVAPPGYVERSS
ncbi:MAG: flavodoxin family protein [Labilithrix sp.]|nr:flavodoxin family protein [Labilithrix sp.]